MTHTFLHKFYDNRIIRVTVNILTGYVTSSMEAISEESEELQAEYNLWKSLILAPIIEAELRRHEQNPL